LVLLHKSKYELLSKISIETKFKNSLSLIISGLVNLEVKELKYLPLLKEDSSTLLSYISPL
jgi:hypothetical protein